MASILPPKLEGEIWKQKLTFLSVKIAVGNFSFEAIRLLTNNLAPDVIEKDQLPVCNNHLRRFNYNFRLLCSIGAYVVELVCFSQGERYGYLFSQVV